MLIDDYRIGEGSEPEVADKNGVMHVKVPDEIVVHGLDHLINEIFPNFDRDTMTGNVIVAPTNDDVDAINENVMKRMPAPGRDFLSSDSVPVGQ